jgi:hypothetical protein
MYIYNEIHVLLSTVTIEHTMTQTGQEHHNNRGGLHRIIQWSLTVGTEEEHMLPQRL